MKMVWIALLLLAFPVFAMADEEDALFTLKDAAGKTITMLAGVPEKGDEYIAGDNAHYRVSSVDENAKTAALELVGQYAMPDVSWLSEDASLPVSAARKAIAIYCTHSDESYKPTDGVTSDEERGGIYDVAEALKEALEAKGVTVYYDDSTHFPHDAGAYRRSRSTATELLGEGVDAILDIHRDGIPDPDEYTANVGDERTTKVRLLVGRANQNAETNKAFAAQIKAIADKTHPGLIKDIYIGKGSYNQDLAPNAILLEFGTYTLSKERAITSTKYMADVLYRALYGGVTGAAGASDVQYRNSASAESESGAWKGTAWVVGIGVVGLLAFGLAASGKGRLAVQKAVGSLREMTLGWFGGKRR